MSTFYKILFRKMYCKISSFRLEYQRQKRRHGKGKDFRLHRAAFYCVLINLNEEKEYMYEGIFKGV